MAPSGDLESSKLPARRRLLRQTLQNLLFLSRGGSMCEQFSSKHPCSTVCRHQRSWACLPCLRRLHTYQSCFASSQTEPQMPGPQTPGPQMTRQQTPQRHTLRCSNWRTVTEVAVVRGSEGQLLPGEGCALPNTEGALWLRELGIRQHRQWAAANRTPLEVPQARRVGAGSCQTREGRCVKPRRALLERPKVPMRLTHAL